MTVPFGIGQPVRRKEDFRLLTGRAEFSDDINADGQAYAIIVRAPHAHATIRSIDTGAARAAPGVLAVLTGRDYIDEGLKPIPNTPNPRDIPLVNRDGSPVRQPPDFPLAIGKVRFAGEGVAMVVAETRAAALDAAEQVAVDYAPLPALVSVADAMRNGAPAIWDDAPGNLCVDCERGNRAEVEAAFARAAHVTRLEIRNNRVTGLPLEPAAALGLYDAEHGYTLRAGGQGILIQKRALAGALGVDESQVRVICRDVGGGFGTRNLIYREYVLVAWAARRVGRPVKWRGERSEAFFFDPYGRDLTSTAELALDAQGNFLAIRTHNIQNVGAQLLHLVPLARGAAVTNGVYTIPAVLARLTAVFTNTAPTSTYRGAGRPEAMFIIERLIDTAAAEMGFDRVKLRRKNFIRPAMLPYVNPMTTRYDSGEFEANMLRALELADAKNFPARRRAAKKRGKRRGLGFANFIETATGIPPERAVIKVDTAGRVAVTLGTQASGQGHETAFAQCIAEWLGVPFDDIELKHGDSAFVLMGSGSHSCRSMRLGGLLMGRASAEIIARGKKLAARALQADENAIDFAGGRFSVRGTERAIGLGEAARLADELREPELRLEASAEITTMLPTFPNGCHVCEVEIDPDTGAVTIENYLAVDDVGRVINPLLVHGQMHGSTAQGAGQALVEDCVYDPASGQLLSGSFMDYAIPRADMFPSFVSEVNEVPAPNNPLGVKGAGEGGTTGAPPAIINAIVDALRDYGVRDVPMPATPQRVWMAIRKGKST